MIVTNVRLAEIYLLMHNIEKVSWVCPEKFGEVRGGFYCKAAKDAKNREEKSLATNTHETT